MGFGLRFNQGKLILDPSKYYYAYMASKLTGQMILDIQDITRRNHKWFLKVFDSPGLTDTEKQFVSNVFSKYTAKVSGLYTVHDRDVLFNQCAKEVQAKIGKRKLEFLIVAINLGWD